MPRVWGWHGQAVMRRLAQAQGRIVPTDALTEAMYPARCPYDPRQCLKVVICRLRKKLPKGAITTHFGEGYSLAREVGAAWLDARDTGA